MSVSMYTSQVNRLTAELATLRGKLADERKKLADANGKALRAVDAMSRATTASQLNMKSRDVERYQKAAADHEKKAADLEKRVADKQKSLSTAQSNLERAQKQQQQKDDREVVKRRQADLDHIKAIERARRQTVSLPQQFEPRAFPARLQPTPRRGSFDEQYDVCLSFAGEQRDYVELIAVALKSEGLRVFYDQDKDIAAKLWGRDLGEVLDYVYREGSRFCLMFISADYAEKRGRDMRGEALWRARSKRTSMSCQLGSTTRSSRAFNQRLATSICARSHQRRSLNSFSRSSKDATR